MSPHIWWMVAGITLVISGISLSEKSKVLKSDTLYDNSVFSTIIFSIGWICLLIVILTSEEYKFIFDTRTILILIAVAIIIISFDIGGFSDKSNRLIVIYSIAYIMLGVAMSFEKSSLGRTFAFIGIIMILFSEFVIIPWQLENDNVIGLGMPTLTVGYILLMLSSMIFASPYML